MCPAIVENGYLENANVAFGVEHGGYLYPKEQGQCVRDIVLMFDLHPQVRNAIFGLCLNFLRLDHLQLWQDELKSLLSTSDCPKIDLLWGTLDTVVSFDHAASVVA